jgi:hypothetical protein
MTDTSNPESADVQGESRRQRLASRRRRNTRIVIATVAILAVGAAATMFAFAFTDDSPATGSPPATVGIGPADALPQIGAVNKASAVRALDHADPLRLWVGGDSLAGSFGPALGDLVGATGVVKTLVDYRVSSGLWSNDIRNWSQRADEQMTSDDPEAVVFIVGANDVSAVNEVDANNDGIPDWEANYRAKVAGMMDTFVGTGSRERTVFWLGAPTLGTKNMDDGAVEINRVVSEEALKRGTNVVFVDTYRMFSGPDGSYSREIVDDKGETITARISDGVHFTPAGASYLARALFALIDARWHLQRQSDTAEPIGWTLASGSGENVPGYRYRPQPRYNTPDYTPTTSAVAVTTPPSTGAVATTVVATSPPTTASPATSPPTTTGHSPPTTKKP